MDDSQYIALLQLQQQQQQMGRPPMPSKSAPAWPIIQQQTRGDAAQVMSGENPLRKGAAEALETAQWMRDKMDERNQQRGARGMVSDLMSTLGTSMLRGSQIPMAQHLGANFATPREREAQEYAKMQDNLKYLNELQELRARQLTAQEAQRHHQAVERHQMAQEDYMAPYYASLAEKAKRDAQQERGMEERRAAIQKEFPGGQYLTDLPQGAQTHFLKLAEQRMSHAAESEEVLSLMKQMEAISKKHPNLSMSMVKALYPANESEANSVSDAYRKKLLNKLNPDEVAALELVSKLHAQGIAMAAKGLGGRNTVFMDRIFGKALPNASLSSRGIEKITEQYEKNTYKKALHQAEETQRALAEGIVIPKPSLPKDMRDEDFGYLTETIAEEKARKSGAATPAPAALPGGALSPTKQALIAQELARRTKGQ